jgi:hypothetical protein
MEGFMSGTIKFGHIPVGQRKVGELAQAGQSFGETPVARLSDSLYATPSLATKPVKGGGTGEFGSGTQTRRGGGGQ